MTELTLKIQGMHCASCAGTIEKGLTNLEGIEKCNVNLVMNTATVKYSNNNVSPELIIARITELGYKAQVSQPDLNVANLARFYFIQSLILTIPLMIVAIIPMLTGEALFNRTIDSLLQALLAGLILFYSGRSIIGDALKQTAHFKANMNSLIAMGTLAAFGWSIYAFVNYLFTGVEKHFYFESSGMIITLILLGRYLEAHAKGRAGEAIKALIKLRPNQTTALINNVEKIIDPAVIKKRLLSKKT